MNRQVHQTGSEHQPWNWQQKNLNKWLTIHQWERMAPKHLWKFRHNRKEPEIRVQLWVQEQGIRSWRRQKPKKKTETKEEEEEKKNLAKMPLDEMKAELARLRRRHSENQDNTDKKIHEIDQWLKETTYDVESHARINAHLLFKQLQQDARLFTFWPTDHREQKLSSWRSIHFGFVCLTQECVWTTNNERHPTTRAIRQACAWHVLERGLAC